ncbi:2-isopropylmalate synthase [Clostridium sporogenes]|nr:2-isopropylmalate synthase [Clostridium sporogenes]NFS26313.1 2-isopropylmalate synthase [Clostridium sporogenes]
MTRKIFIFDTTLRDGEQSPGASLNIHEKLQIARQLEKLGVDAIEAGFPIASNGDFEAVKAIAESIKGPTIVGLARAKKQDIHRAWEALQYAGKPRIHTFIATSDIHMKYKLKMTREEVLEQAVEAVKYARSLCPDVEFSPEDASRTQPEFLYKVLEAVIDAGATVINIPDTVGYSTPDEFGGLIKKVRKNVKNIGKALISVHCHNDLGMAVSNALAAVEEGADQVECTINGLGERAGNTSLEEIVMALKTRGNYYKCYTDIISEQLYRASTLVSHLTGLQIQANKAIVGANAFAHESGIHQHGMLNNPETYEIMTPESIGLKQSQMVLGKHSGRHAFEEKLRELGYDLSAEDINSAFIKFKEVADKKKYVMDKDIEVMVNQKTSMIPAIYELQYYHVSNGNTLVSTSAVKIKKDNDVIEEAACGHGPVDAIFKAVDRAIGREIILEDYFLKAVTSGKDAIGEVTARVSSNDRIFVGKGISTDVIEASAKAYISAINKMVYEERCKSM